jgi:chromosome segregation ATPase
MSKKIRTIKNQRVKSGEKLPQGGHSKSRKAAKKEGGLKSSERDFESSLQQIRTLRKEHENDIRTIGELTKSNAEQEELLVNERNLHVSQSREMESGNQMLASRCNELAAQLKDAQAKCQECDNILIAKEEHERVLKEELSRAQWCLGEEKELRRLAEDVTRQKQAELERHEAEMCRVSNLRKELSECQWHLGEERALRQKAETSLGESSAFIEQQKNDLNQRQSDLDVVTKQSHESQRSLGEVQARIRTLEEYLMAERKRSEGLSGQIFEMQEALAKSNLLAAEWMRRWNSLIEEALKCGGELDREQIEDGKFLERQLFFSRQEIEALTSRKTELEEQFRQVEADVESLLRVNAGLKEELSAERQKQQALEKRYSESEWYLQEARANLQKVKEVPC